VHDELLQALENGRARDHTILGALQLGRRHHLHGVVILMCILYTRNATDDITAD